MHSTGTTSLASLGSLTIGGGSQMGGGSVAGKEGEAVPVGFDEGVLRGLCEMDVSLMFGDYSYMGSKRSLIYMGLN